ncbi:oleate-activated transcription factor 1 [Fusarium flagelliforme]|uniref:Oleate-activated transcription factor 1 n=2 Tax=Fusarium flagelliforme TaxID=2675880 RepID=A0A395MV39_9HYPO|nr:oleate-activated transcription factor 1 [Fusarium flagelliforme]
MSYNQFPNRRRVIQACVNCRMRKTRCDAAQPKCGLCTTQNVDCVYRDARQPKIDYNTQVLLERMQLLEDRLLSTSRNNPSQPQGSGIDRSSIAEQQSESLPEPTTVSQEPVFEVQIPLSHTANANHVFSWGLVQDLLSEASNNVHDMEAHTDATDVFFHPQPNNSTPYPPSSWKLFDEKTLSFSNSVDVTVFEFRGLIHLYFTDVNIFFPLLLKSDIIEILDATASREVYGREMDNNVEMPHYGLLLVVLCLALLSASGQSNIRLTGEDGSQRPPSRTVNAEDELRYHLWDKAKLVLGYIMTDMSLATAQSSMLASIYTGACGLVAEAFRWAHATAVKCESMARSYAKEESIPDAFRRLYWISFIYECDFISEISIISPSGIARYEDKIPYPAFVTEPAPVSPSAPESSGPSNRVQEELVAFQITTNSAIRRFLNTVNSVVYDDKEQFRTRKSNYASWLLRISEDLWSHHSAIYRNLPEFLLTASSQDVSMTGTDPNSPASLQSPTARIQNMPTGNNSWNILRLKGRYFAGQYIIHRPFIEFIVLNIDNFETHPCKEAILKKSKSCLDGCMGFIKVFDVETVNSLTCLFPTGMV